MRNKTRNAQRPDPKRLESDARAFASRFREAREAAELGLEEAAALLGVSRQTVYAWERGLSVPAFRQLLAICNAFGWPNPMDQAKSVRLPG
jgi:DNA-binding XRE family transcriptional regulator